jgi:hypothetical protein
MSSDLKQKQKQPLIVRLIEIMALDRLDKHPMNLELHQKILDLLPDQEPELSRYCQERQTRPNVVIRVAKKIGREYLTR